MGKLITYHIEVNGGTALVTPDPGVLTKKDHDEAMFTSNDETTVIQYRDTSPFAEAEIGPKKPLHIGKGNGKKYRGVNVGRHHFDCGFRNPAAGGSFSPWGKARHAGADTPLGKARQGGPDHGGADTDVDP